MLNAKYKYSFLFLLMILMTAVECRAEHPTYLGAFKDWKTFSFKENGQLGCYAISDPIAVEGLSGRTNSHIYISHRPALNNFNEVSFTIGYNLKKKSDVSVFIDGQEFLLVANGNKAWTKNANEDQKLVQAILKGSKLILKATLRSNKGLKQTYSLRGATAAHQLLNKKCPIPHETKAN